MVQGLMRCIPSSSEALYRKWNELVKDNIRNGNKREFDHNIKNIVREFDQLEVTDIKKPKVAIVGEILAKYHPMANNGIISSLEEGGAEVVLRICWISYFIAYLIQNLSLNIWAEKG